MERKSPEDVGCPRLKCNICGCFTVLSYIANDFVVPAPNVDNSYSFICEQCNKDTSGQPVFEHRSKTWLELVATATFNTARLSHSQYVKVADIVHYLEEHQVKLNLNLTRVDKNVFRQRVNVTLCRYPKLFETAARGSGSYRLNENYHAKPNKRVFSHLFDQQPSNTPPSTPPLPMDNSSFESIESFLLQGDEPVLVKLEPGTPQAHNPDHYILEFLTTNNHTRHVTHPPMMLSNNNIIFPPHTLSSSPMENSADGKNDLLHLMLQVSADPQSLGIVPNQSLSLNASNPNFHFGLSYIDYHTVVCEACEQASVREDEKFILAKFLLPGPQDKNYVFTCGTCAGDGIPTMVHKIKNRLEFTSSVLYTLQQSQGQSIFTMKDIYYVAEKHSHLLKTNAKSLRNVVRAALSDYRNLFQSFGHGLWGFCIDSVSAEESQQQKKNAPLKQKFDKLDITLDSKNKRPKRAGQEMNSRIPISPDLALPKPEPEGIHLCWEGENKFSGFIFVLPNQTLAFLRHEILAYGVLGVNPDFSFVFQDAPLSALQEEAIFVGNCAVLLRGKLAMITRRI